MALVSLVWLSALASPAAADTATTPASPSDAVPPPIPLADGAPLVPRHRVVYSNLLAARYNPLGLSDEVSVGYRYRLYDRRGTLWDDANLRVAFEPSVSPAIGRVGGTVELVPLAVLKLRASYHFVGYFGTFGDLQSYPSPLATFSDTALSAGESAGRSYATYGGQAELTAILQVKLGPIAARSELTFIRSDMTLRPGDTVFYDPGDDELSAGHGWVVTNDADLVYVTPFGLIAGVRVSTVEPFYPASSYPAGSPHADPNGPTWRAGPLAAYTLLDRPGARVDNVTVFAIVNWWLESRYRTGEDVSQAVPYLAAGVAFSGELLAWKPRLSPR